jgi:hypothetical protein
MGTLGSSKTLVTTVLTVGQSICNLTLDLKKKKKELEQRKRKNVHYFQHFSKPATHSEIQPELSYTSKLV